MNKQDEPQTPPEPSAQEQQDNTLAASPPASTAPLSDGDLDRVAGGYFDDWGEWVPTFGVN